VVVVDNSLSLSAGLANNEENVLFRENAIYRYKPVVVFVAKFSLIDVKNVLF